MTVAEYARWCADIEMSYSGENAPAAWGELEERLQEALDLYAGIRDQVPAELEDYVGTQESLFRTLHDFAQLRDRDALFNTFELLLPGLAIAGSVEAATGALTPSTRTALVSTGCIDEDDDSAEQQQHA